MGFEIQYSILGQNFWLNSKRIKIWESKFMNSVESPNVLWNLLQFRSSKTFGSKLPTILYSIYVMSETAMNYRRDEIFLQT